MTGAPLNDKLLLRTAALWEIEPVRVIRSAAISGSPERSELRYVIEGAGQKRYVLESVFGKDLETKMNIVRRLDELSARGLKGINPYLKSASQKSIEKAMNRYWKVSPFVGGCELTRPGYVYDEWRGDVLADFLIQMRRVSEPSGVVFESLPFSLKDYISTLFSEIEVYNPEVASELSPVISFLEKGFMKNHDRLDTAFCHGDYHPLNVIWGDARIKAVIDWEFCGVKPEIYDTANLLGCLGIEKPDSLTGPFARAFTGRLKKKDCFSQFSWQNLFSFIVAIRFAWLAEWLRKKDTEMIEMELVYMTLLIHHEKEITGAWGI